MKIPKLLAGSPRRALYSLLTTASICRFHDVLLALTLGLAISLVHVYNPTGHGEFFYRLEDWLPSFAVCGWDVPSGSLAISICAVSLSAPLYILFHLAGRYRAKMALLHGLLWIEVVPACWLWIYDTVYHWPGNAAAAVSALLLLPLLRLLARRHKLLAVGVLALHFGFWLSRYLEVLLGDVFNPLSPLNLLTIMAFVGALLWVRLINLTAQPGSVSVAE